MLLLNLDDKHRGIAVLNGVAYRVEGLVGLNPAAYFWPPNGDNATLKIELKMVASLDEEQQRKRIERLEIRLQQERERLEDIRRMAADEDES